eukprot:s863_g48.t1
MHRVIQHDALAAGILNSDYTGGTAQFATWKDELCNSDSLLTVISKRLSQKLAALKFEEAQINIEKDIEQISSWSQRFDAHSARQAGSLDVKYLQDRYAKGMDRVSTLLKHSQRFIHVDDLTEAGNDVIAQTMDYWEFSINFHDDNPHGNDKRVSVPEGAEVHVFDLTPNRFAEWSRAVWDRQLHNLKNPDACVEKFTYTGYFLDTQEADSQRKDMADTDAEVEAGELMGFNVGNFKEIALGAIAACKVDTQLVNWVTNNGKEVLCLADLLCKLASDRGVMQVTLADHDMEQMVKDPYWCM